MIYYMPCFNSQNCVCPSSHVPPPHVHLCPAARRRERAAEAAGCRALHCYTAYHFTACHCCRVMFYCIPLLPCDVRCDRVLCRLRAWTSACAIWKKGRADQSGTTLRVMPFLILICPALLSSSSNKCFPRFRFAASALHSNGVIVCNS